MSAEQAALKDQLMKASGDSVDSAPGYKVTSEEFDESTNDQEVSHMDANGDDTAIDAERMLQGGHGHECNPDDEAIDEQPDVSKDSTEESESTNQNKNVTSTPSSSGQHNSTNASAIPCKGENSDSRVYEEGDDSFVVQVDDTVLNDIDSDLVGQDKSSTAAQGPKDETGTNAEGTEVQETSSGEKSNCKDGTAQASNGDKDGKSAAKSGDAKTVKKDQKASQCSRNLWVSGLSSLTRATDLKNLFSKHGKVVGAKVVANARSPGSRCYGFVTMGTADEATKCIQHIHRTELHGRLISVERAKTEPLGEKGAKVLPPSSVRSPTKASSVSSRSSTSRYRKEHPRHSSSKPEGQKKDETKAEEPVKSETDKDESEEKAGSQAGSNRGSRDRSSDRTKRELTLEKIKAERERRRLINKEIQLRQEERRAQMDMEREQFKQQQREKRISDEARRMEREKRKLREMREELERERMKTERLKLETERLQIERERERVLQERRPVKRPMDRGDEWSGGKRAATDRFQADGRQSHYERKGERFDRREPERASRYESWREERPGRHDRYEGERGGREARVEREYGRSDEHRTGYREESSRDQSGRGVPRHDSRSEWKSDRETSRGGGESSTMWKGDHKGGWSQGGSQDSWENGGAKKWMDKSLENLISEKNLKFRKWRKTGTERDLEEYRRVRNLTRKEIRTAKEAMVAAEEKEGMVHLGDGVWKSPADLRTYTFDFYVTEYSKNAPQSSEVWDIGADLPQVKAVVGFWRGTMRAFLQYKSLETFQPGDAPLSTKLRVTVWAVNQDGSMEDWQLGTKEVDMSVETPNWKSVMNTSWRKGLQKQTLEDQLLLRYEITIL